jgi:hypothetical protein
MFIFVCTYFYITYSGKKLNIHIDIDMLMYILLASFMYLYICIYVFHYICASKVGEFIFIHRCSMRRVKQTASEFLVSTFSVVTLCKCNNRNRYTPHDTHDTLQLQQHFASVTTLNVRNW